MPSTGTPNLKTAGEAAGFGTYEYNAATGEAYWSAYLRRLVGIEGEAPLSLEDVIAVVHPEHRGMVRGHVLGYAQETGFGLVQALARLDLPALSLGQSSTATVGESVVVAGAGGRHHSVAAHIAARQEFAKREVLDRHAPHRVPIADPMPCLIGIAHHCRPSGPAAATNAAPGQVARRERAPRECAAGLVRVIVRMHRRRHELHLAARLKIVERGRAAF